MHPSLGHFWFHLLGKAQNSSRKVALEAAGGTVTRNTSSGELELVFPPKLNSHLTPACGKSYSQVDPDMGKSCLGLLLSPRSGQGELLERTFPESQGTAPGPPAASYALLLPVLPAAAPGGPPATETASEAAQGFPGRTSGVQCGWRCF